MTTDQKIIGGVALLSALILGFAVFFMGGNKPSAAPVDQSLLVKESSNKTGVSDAKVTIVEFGDYQCPACAMAHPVTKQLMQEYQGKVNFVFRHFPLSQHANAMVSAKAAEAAGSQGKFWEMHDKLYANQPEWETEPNAVDIFTKYAVELGLDEAKFRQEVNSDIYFDKINGDRNDGNAVGVNSTPTFYINGVKTNGFAYPEMKKLIDQSLQ